MEFNHIPIMLNEVIEEMYQAISDTLTMLLSGGQ